MKGFRKCYIKTERRMYVLISAILVFSVLSLNVYATPDEDLLKAIKDGNFKAVRLALKNGANVNTQYSSDVTALMSAVRTGQLAIVRVLLKHNADTNATAEGGVYGPNICSLRWIYGDYPTFTF